MIVVAAVVVRGGRVLAARRTRPAELAGGWEFPGGKVEPGETEPAALARECVEELGIRIDVLDRLGPDIALPSGYVLRGYLARLTDDSAEPLAGNDHDDVRWLTTDGAGGTDGLDGLPWLPHEHPLVEAARTHLRAANPLPGGNVGGAVRLGDTVRRPAGPWTPTIHALLDHVRGAGLTGVPEPLGIDEEGREVLSFTPGETVGAGTWPAWAWSDDLLDQVMQWLAHYHHVVRSFRPVSPVWRLDPRPLGRDEIVCHNDIAPYNLVVGEPERRLRLAGVLDWDVAGPGLPIDDLAFAAWNFVPLWDAGLPNAETERRLWILVTSYGSYGRSESRIKTGPALQCSPADVLQRVPTRLRAGFARIRAGAERGDAGMRNLLGSGRISAAESSLATLEERLPELLCALR